MGKQTWILGGGLAGGRKYLDLGPGKNGGYHRAGRVGVSTGGRLRWGRINISAVDNSKNPKMTGRYGNRRGGRGGRGRGRTSSTKPAYTKKTVEDYFFYVGSSKQASDYEITNEFVVNHIKKAMMSRKP
jgi:hypothetical protein